METLLHSPASACALIGVLVLILAFLHIRRIRLDLHALINVALLIGIALILQQIRIFHMPQGGSITLGGMVPLLILSYRYGPGIGALGGFVFGCISILQDPYILHPVQVLFDYPLPYMMMGLAGLSRAHLYLGTLLAFLARMTCHVISGVVFFASFAPEGQDPLTYSLLFNGTYLVPDCVICLIILRFLPLQRLLDAMDAHRAR